MKILSEKELASVEEVINHTKVIGEYNYATQLGVALGTVLSHIAVVHGPDMIDVTLDRFKEYLKRPPKYDSYQSMHEAYKMTRDVIDTVEQI